MVSRRSFLIFSVLKLSIAMKPGFVKGIILGAVALVLILSMFNIDRGLADIRIGRARFFVEIADEPEEYSRGLSGREKLAANKGMLFIFSQPGNYGFWMKEMKFPLDFVWIKGDQVVGLTENTPPPQFTTYDVVNLPLYYPPEAVDKVLEVNAGAVEKFKIKIGDLVKLKR